MWDVGKARKGQGEKGETSGKGYITVIIAAGAAFPARLA
jgi:hypothetical protein